MSAIYCVFGHPVAHSRSPEIHHAFAAQFDMPLRYERRLAPLDGFAGSVADFIAAGGRGANVTVPFKQEALALAEVVAPRARRAGAVNTLSVDDEGRLQGDTTDGVGLVRDLERLGARLEGARIAVLGAGGAVRGVLEPLLEHRPQALFVANRTAERARQLAERFAGFGPIAGGAFDQLEGRFDLVINGTSASLGAELPPLPEGLFANDALAYDMVYAAQPTVFMRWAEQRGARSHDGLGMLVEQAAESFFIWHNLQPDTGAVLAGMRGEASAG